MELYILDNTFARIAVIDEFTSLIWTKRYYTCGDFELYIPADDMLLPYLDPDESSEKYIERDDDDTIMIIETLAIKTDVENGDYFIVTGRSLESILARRVILSQTVVNNSDVVQGMKSLIVAHTGNGNPLSYRAFQNFSIDDSLTYTADIVTQFTGDVLLDAVSGICKRFGIGMKMTVSGSAITLAFFVGPSVDVTFSPDFDNLINSQYLKDYTSYANYAIVAGEGEGTSRIMMNVMRGTAASGFQLREMFVDARDMSSNKGKETEIPSIEYLAMLAERGKEKLAERVATQSFEADVEPRMTYQYKDDWNLGDVVKVTNEYGITAQPRIVEIIECWDAEGYTAIPTFDSLDIVS